MPATNLSRPRVSPVLTLGVGLVVGWSLASSRTAPVRAYASDRSDESVLLSAPTSLKYNEGAKVQVPQDAVYLLDYRAGKLLVTIPAIKQSGGSSQAIEGFAERDLVADFKIDTRTDASPHFLMTTASTSNGSAYGDGGALLLVFETSSRQVAVYKAEQQTIGTTNPAKLSLLQVRPYAAPVTR